MRLRSSSNTDSPFCSDGRSMGDNHLYVAGLFRQFAHNFTTRHGARLVAGEVAIPIKTVHRNDRVIADSHSSGRDRFTPVGSIRAARADWIIPAVDVRG